MTSSHGRFHFHLSNLLHLHTTLTLYVCPFLTYLASDIYYSLRYLDRQSSSPLHLPNLSPSQQRIFAPCPSPVSTKLSPPYSCSLHPHDLLNVTHLAVPWPTHISSGLTDMLSILPRSLRPDLGSDSHFISTFERQVSSDCSDGQVKLTNNGFFYGGD